ncbi:MAG: glycosyltransferase [Cyanobacteria bacterium]|jgi:glycosyltransferase involved in cell wall biosynthesis|nr:glycosyltransferase [Cyanobacteria bacterium GSL.Bin1]
MTLPLVTVIIPSYNYGQFIGEAIDSVLASDYPQELIEIIVIDDGSTDNTADVVKAYGNRVHYNYIQNTRKAGALKLGIELSQGKYIFNLDADDLFAVEKIRKVVEIFESDDEITHVSHINNYWNVKTGLKNPENIPTEILEKKINGNELLAYFYSRKLIFGGGSTYAARAEAIKGKLFFRREMDIFVDEYLAIVTMSLESSYFIAEPLTLYRLHGNNGTSNEGGNLNISKLRVRVNSTKAIEQQLRQSDALSNQVKALYKLKSKEYSLYCKKMACEDSLLDGVNLYFFILKNTRYFGKYILLIFWSYHLYKYLIPSSLFLPIKRIKRSIIK